MNRIITIGRILAATAVVLAVQACAGGMALVTVPANRTELSGSYTLLLYGCHYPDQIENVVILADESSKYPIEIYDLDTSYKVRKGVTGQEALRDADSFLNCSMHGIWQTQLMRIPDGQGGTAGYEVRPLYHPFEFGTPDVLLTDYWLKDGKIRAYIRKIPELEDRGGGADKHGGSSSRR